MAKHMAMACCFASNIESFDSKPYVCLAELQLQKAIKVPLPGVCIKALAGNLHEAKASTTTSKRREISQSE